MLKSIYTYLSPNLFSLCLHQDLTKSFLIVFSPHPMYFGGVVKMFMPGLDERGDVRVGGGC